MEEASTHYIYLHDMFRLHIHAILYQQNFRKETGILKVLDNQFPTNECHKFCVIFLGTRVN